MFGKGNLANKNLANLFVVSCFIFAESKNPSVALHAGNANVKYESRGVELFKIHCGVAIRDAGLSETHDRDGDVGLARNTSLGLLALTLPSE